MFCWVKPVDNTGFYDAIAVGNASGNEEITYWLRAPNGIVQLRTTDTAGTPINTEIPQTQLTSWQPMMVAMDTENTGFIYYSNFTRVAINTGQTITLANMTQFIIGFRGSSDASTHPFSGDMAEVACWQGTIPTQTDYNNMLAGSLPESIQAGTLRESWKLETATDLAGRVSRTLTATSLTTSATHPITRGATSIALSESEWNPIEPQTNPLIVSVW
jgi:hypothetical protein